MKSFLCHPNYSLSRMLLPWFLGKSAWHWIYCMQIYSFLAGKIHHNKIFCPYCLCRDFFSCPQLFSPAVSDTLLLDIACSKCSKICVLNLHSRSYFLLRCSKCNIQD